MEITKNRFPLKPLLQKPSWVISLVFWTTFKPLHAKPINIIQDFPWLALTPQQVQQIPGDALNPVLTKLAKKNCGQNKLITFHASPILSKRALKQGDRLVIAQPELISEYFAHLGNGRKSRKLTPREVQILIQNGRRNLIIRNQKAIPSYAFDEVWCDRPEVPLFKFERPFDDLNSCRNVKTRPNQPVESLSHLMNQIRVQTPDRIPKEPVTKEPVAPNLALRPQTIHFDRNSQECRDWVDAHRVLCGEDQYRAAKFLLDQIEYVPYSKFEQLLHRQVKKLLEKIGKERFVIPVEKGKSSEWIFKTVKPLLDANGSKYDVIELKPGESKPLRDYLQSHKGVKHFVRIDDAIYSGTQMEGYFSSAIRAFATSGNLNAAQFHLIAGYSTRKGAKLVRDSLLSDSQIRANQLNIQIGAPINTIEEIVSNSGSPERRRLLETLDKMYSNKSQSPQGTAKGLTHLFFQHKVPDNLSVAEDFLRFGYVKCNQQPVEKVESSQNSIPISFDCVPNIVPPYKKSSGYLRGVENAKNQREADLYAQAKKKVIEKIRKLR